MLKIRAYAVAKKIKTFSDRVIDDFKSEIISGEESMTDRLAQSITAAVDGKVIGNLRWKSRTLKTSRGRGAEEKRHGADLLGVLEIDLPEFKKNKGFLWQAKIIEPEKPLSDAEWKKFQEQCDKMLQRTHEAFGVIYSRTDGVRIINADLITRLNRDQVYDVGSQSIFGFFRSHIKCEIGDYRLDSPKIATLERLAEHPGFLDQRILALKVSNV